MNQRKWCTINIISEIQKISHMKLSVIYIYIVILTRYFNLFHIHAFYFKAHCNTAICCASCSQGDSAWTWLGGPQAWTPPVPSSTSTCWAWGSSNGRKVFATTTWSEPKKDSGECRSQIVFFFFFYLFVASKMSCDSHVAAQSVRSFYISPSLSPWFGCFSLFAANLMG